jgi:polyisoprenoid-binding protein YceI
MKSPLLALAIPLLAAGLSSPPATAQTWNVDPSHSSAEFSVRHLMISSVRGTFSKVGGTITGDPKNPSGLTINATVDVASVDTREPDRDKHLRSPDFFDAEKFPVMTFKSKRVTAAGAGKMKITGDLTIKGITKEVVLDVEGPTPEIKDPSGNTRIGASATTTINRKDFNILWNKTMDSGGMVVGEDVKITIDVELIKKS